MKPIARKHKQKRKVQPLTLSEVRKLLNNSNPTYKLIYSIAGFMGLRLTEILYIQIKDIDFNNKILHYRVAKSDEVTERYIPDFVLDQINERIKGLKLLNYDYLFKSRLTTRLSEKSVSKRTKYLFIKLGISKPVKKREIRSELNPIKEAEIHDKTFHSLRHTYGTEVWEICENDEITAKTLRHQDGNCETIKVYRAINIQKRELAYSNTIINKAMT